MEYINLGQISTITNGKRNAQDAIENGPYPLFDRSVNVKRSDKYMFDKEAIIVAGEGKTFLPKYYKGKFDLHQRCYAIFDFANGIHPKYIYYYIQWNQAYFQSVYTGSTVPSLRLGNFENMPVKLCTVNHQEQIAINLDNINLALSKKQQELSSLDELVKSRFIEMFGHYFEDSRYFVKVGDIATATIGLTYKPDNVSDEGIIVLRSGNIQNAELCLSDDIVRVSNIKIKEDKFVRENDILMCSRNGSARLVGKCCLIPKLDEQMSYGAFMTVIRSKYPYFLNGFFNSTYFLQQLTGTQTASVNQITTGMLNGYTIIKPSDAEENEFAEFVKLIDKSKFVCHSKNFLCDIFTFSSSTIAYPSVVSIFVCPKRC